MLHWDDLRYVLVVAHTGSMAAAGRELGVDQTTVARRIAAAERALGTTIFHRERMRLVPTRAGTVLLERAERIEHEIRLLQRTATDGENQYAGTVRITAPVAFATRLLAPKVADFRRAYPGIRLELVGDLSRFAMGPAHADVGLRISHALPDHLEMRAVSDVAFGFYANPEAMRANGMPLDLADLRRNPLVGYPDELAQLPEQRWMAEIFGARELVFASNSVATLANASEAGLGIAALPCYIGDRLPGLQRVPGCELLRSERLWLVTLPELRRTTRVRAVVDFLVRVIRQRRPLLSGQTPLCHPVTLLTPIDVARDLCAVESGADGLGANN